MKEEMTEQTTTKPIGILTMLEQAKTICRMHCSDTCCSAKCPFSDNHRCLLGETPMDWDLEAIAKNQELKIKTLS